MYRQKRELEVGPKFLAHHFDDAEQQFDSAKLGMWCFLVTEILMFGGEVIVRDLGSSNGTFVDGVKINPQMQLNPNPITPPAFSPTPVDEARRLESVAAEVRRRRALRQSAAQQPPGLEQPTSLPPPQNSPPNSPSVLPR